MIKKLLFFALSMGILQVTFAQQLDCSNATPLLVNNIPVDGDTSTGNLNVASYNNDANWKLTGPEVVYELNWSGGDIELQLTNKTANLQFIIIDSCNPENYISAGGFNDGTADSTFRGDLNAGNYFIVVDGWNGASGTYSLVANKKELDCASATNLTLGTKVTGTTETGQNNITNYPGVKSLDGKEAIYKFNWSGGEFKVELTKEKGKAIDYFVLENCDLSGTFLNIHLNLTDTDSKNFHSLPAGSYYIVIDGQTETDNGSFELLVYPAELDCANTKRLEIGQTLELDTNEGSNNVAKYFSSLNIKKFPDFNGKEIIHKVDWEGGTMKLELSDKKDENGNPIKLDILVLPDCKNQNVGYFNSKEFTLSDNSTFSRELDAGTYFIVVDGVNTTDVGSYKIKLSQVEKLNLSKGKPAKKEEDIFFTLENNILYQIDTLGNQIENVLDNVASFGKSFGYVEVDTYENNQEEVLWVKRINESKPKRRATDGTFNNDYLKQSLDCAVYLELYGDVVYDGTTKILENADILRCENGNVVSHQRDGSIKLYTANSNWININQIITIDFISYYVSKDDDSIWQVDYGTATKIGNNAKLLQDNDNQLIKIDFEDNYFRWNGTSWIGLTPKHISASPTMLDEGFWFFIQSKTLLLSTDQFPDHYKGMSVDTNGDVVMKQIPWFDFQDNCDEFLWRVSTSNGNKVLINKAMGISNPLIINTDGSITFTKTTPNSEYLSLELSDKNIYGTNAYTIKGQNATRALVYNNTNSSITAENSVNSDDSQTWVFQFAQMVKNYFLPKANKTNLAAHFENPNINLATATREIEKSYNKFLKADYGITVFGTNTTSDWATVNHYFLVNNMLNAIQNPLPTNGGGTSNALDSLRGQSMVIINKNDANFTIAKQYFTTSTTGYQMARFRGFSGSGEVKKVTLVSEELTMKNGIVNRPLDQGPRRFDHGVHEFTHTLQAQLNWIDLVDAIPEICESEKGENSECFCVATQAWFDSNSINFDGSEQFLFPTKRESNPGFAQFMEIFFNPKNTWMPQKQLRPNGYSPSGPTSDVQNIFWSGNIDANWNNPMNWTPNAVPTELDNVTINSVTRAPKILSGQNHTVNNLTVKDSLTIASKASLIVDGDLDQQEVIIINSSQTDSGSLIVIGNQTNTNPSNTIYNRYVSSNYYNSISSPLANVDITNFTNSQPLMGDNTTKWLYFFETENNFYTWKNSSEVNYNSFISGEGISAAANDNNFEFSGKIVNDNINVPLKTNTLRVMLVGNPYTGFLKINNSADDVNNFFSKNTSILDPNASAIYRVDWVNRKIITLGNGIEPEYIAPGQAFFIKYKEGMENETVSFTKEMVTHRDDYLWFKAAPTPKIVLELEGDAISAETTIAFKQAMTKGLDVGFDAELPTDLQQLISDLTGVTNVLSFSSQLQDLSQDNPFSVQFLPENELEVSSSIIPLGINYTSNSDFILKIKDYNIENTNQVFLEDKESNTFVELKRFTDYRFTQNSNSNTFGRFYLHIQNRALSTSTNQESSINVFKTKGNRLSINGLKENGTLTIFDMNGRNIIKNIALLPNKNIVELPKLVKGIYVMKITNTKGRSFSKKILW